MSQSHGYSELAMLIDGAWTQGSSGRRETVINPANGDALGELPLASTADLDRSLAAAQKGFATWSAMSPLARQVIMNKAADLMEQRRREIAQILTLEMGKSVAESLVEMDFVIGVTRWCGEEGKRAYGRLIPSRNTDTRYLAIKEPIGPACAFTAWNFPGTNVIRKIAHGLGAGCSVIVKPSEETPATAIQIARCFQEAGLPEGVLQLVFGVPDEVSRHLIASPVTKKLSFTGSVPVGKHLARLAADSMMRATMELGGHAPVMVMADADIEEVARVMGAFKFRNGGQVCVSPTRFLVEREVYGDFVDAMSAVANSIKVGNGLENGVQMGPLVAERRIPVMEAFVADAKARGASIAAGGERIGNIGSFFAPTIIADANDDMTVMNEEPFGPLAPISPVDSVDEMIERANRLSVGLAGYAFTRDGALAERLSREVQVGMLGINSVAISLPETPFGGIDESGYGHEGGAEGLEAYQRTRLIVEKR